MTVPVDAKRLDWPRIVANNVNRSVKRDGQVIYTAPTASAAYDQAQMQELMDAISAISDRLK